MMVLKFKPVKIYIEEKIKQTALCHRILSCFPNVVAETVEDANTVLERAAHGERAEWCNTLLLAAQRGPFLRLCPGTQNHICCLYHNLDVAAGCNLGCSYCILQGYLDNPLLTVYCNTDEMYAELENRLNTHSRQFFRIGTGELSDSLSFDDFLGFGADLAMFFADKKNAIIELKTKSVNIDGLFGVRHNGRTVVSWSLNADEISRSEESIAPGIDERLRAAREVQKAGYRLGFHFDPMICYPGWQEGYRETVDKIFKYIHPENIVWISLGALRYPAAFDQVIRNNHPDSDIVLGELLPGRDKKLRYFRPLRTQLFRQMVNWIKEYSPEVLVYLCMESKTVWDKVFTTCPANSAELKKMLDARVK